MTNKETKVKVEQLPKCDICKQRDAHYDGKTRLGPWAYMCLQCFGELGVGLGVGKGQELIVNE